MSRERTGRRGCHRIGGWQLRRGGFPRGAADADEVRVLEVPAAAELDLIDHVAVTERAGNLDRRFGTIPPSRPAPLGPATDTDLVRRASIYPGDTGALPPLPLRRPVSRSDRTGWRFMLDGHNRPEVGICVATSVERSARDRGTFRVAIAEGWWDEKGG